MQAVFFYISGIAFALGLLVATFYNVSLVWVLWLCVVATSIFLVAWRQRGGVVKRVVMVGCVAFIAFSLGVGRLAYEEISSDNQYFSALVGESIEITGIVSREPDVRERSTQFFLQTDEGTILVRTDRYANIEYGDRAEIEGVVEVPEPFETDLGRTFNYPGYLEAKGVSHVIPFASVSVLDRGQGNPVMHVLLASKHRFMELIEQMIPDPQAGLGEGLLLGVKQALGEELETAFRKTGIIHIVVLSGYNVMLVVAFILFVFSFFLGFRARIIFGLGAIIAFALLVGLSATVVRASIMAGLLLVAQLFGRTYQVLRGLVIAGIIMLVINPYLISYDVGFQLSFMATLGLILVAPYLEARLQRVTRVFGVREFLIATLATQIFVSPLLLYQIGEFSVVAVVVNVLVLPMVPLAMLLTFVAGAIGFVSTTLALPVAWLAYASLSYIIILCEGFASLPFASYVIPAFSFWFVPLVYLIMGYVIWRWYQNSSIVFGYGDMAERLLHTTTLEDNVLEGWIIEEELVVKERLQKRHEGVGATAPTPSPSDETPVFFR